MQDWNITAEEKLVVAFDMCSSSNVIEDLTLTGNVAKLLYVLDELKQLLYEKKSYDRKSSTQIEDQSERLQFVPYKFTGDGWILLFSPNTSGQDLVRFLHLLSHRFDNRFRRIVEPFLDRPPKIRGLTFGIDFGYTYRTRVFGDHEYIGRPLNVACRLQGAVNSEQHETPVYRALVSPSCYQRFFATVPDISRYNPTRAVRRLRNILGGRSLNCRMLSFPVKGG